MYKDLKTENIKLKQAIEMQGQTIEMQGQTIEMQEQALEMQEQALEMQEQALEMQEQALEKLKQSVAELKRRLVRHDNYNTPPSQKKGPGWPDAKKSDDKNNGNNKSTKTRKGRSRENAAGSQKPRGGQKGHEGKTRRPKPTEFKEHTPDACPGCGSDNLSITKTIQRDQGGATVRSMRHTINTCRCSCGQKDIESETPSRQGKLRFEHNCRGGRRLVCRMPFRMIADWMARHGIPLSTGTAHNIIMAAIAAMIRKARILHIDETSIHLNGHNVWVWCTIR